MAQIYIKGRREPIEVTNDVARAVKRRWCGDVATGAGKATKDDILQLDDWAGEYGMIKMIELDKITPVTDYEASRRAEQAREDARRQQWLELTPEKKAGYLEHFKLKWFVHSKFTQKEPPPDVLEKARELQLKFFQENPTAEGVPKDLFRELLPGTEHSLAENMKMK